MMNWVTLLLLAAVAQAAPAADQQLKGLLADRGAQIGAEISGLRDGPEAFSAFYRKVVDGLRDGGGSATLADRLALAGTDRERTAGVEEEIAWIIHTYAREYYRDAVVRETGNLIRFKTFATDLPNRQNPEFVAQKEYLRGLADRLGLNFNDVGGFVQEIWIGEGERSFGIMSHSDVQPVVPSEWDHDPWSGEVIDGALWGRGSVDDKGPICAVLYGMRAVLDSGFPVRQKVILLVGTDEESANEDVSTYLSTNPAPDQTIVVDSNFPVVCAEKGWGGIWLSLPRSRDDEDAGIRIVSIEAGFSPSIVPETAVARVVDPGRDGGALESVLGKAATQFMAARNNARMTVEEAGDTVIITAFGKSVHSSVPATGHNALMDLLVFLDEDVRPVRNSYSLMAKFAARYIGFELDGSSLGIAHHDDFMGDVTVAGNMFSWSDTSVTFMFNFRRPRGSDTRKVVESLEDRFRAFEREFGVTFSDRRYIGEPHYTDPESPFVRNLLSIYNSIMGENRTAQSIGGGTYAQRIPNAVVFGPALPDEEYLGHQPNERLRLNTLERNVEILTHTISLYGLFGNPPQD